ncbi:Uncharacterised protein [Acinetobacter baumannii]|nr:Uncharacterised protein [Acinetobacter phage MD-2021a]SSR93863.1 Uncharacterised protein [Acinetobacter baumannii]SSW87103.1 Uncharacterised protein [Klebsiella pneumoniae]CAH1096733.1 Uncharacterised protein [Acinetobacter phage MD-2021a]SSS38281.1 Uncharacterised protein [Acinetobacter baumannii]
MNKKYSLWEVFKSTLMISIPIFLWKLPELITAIKA